MLAAIDPPSSFVLWEGFVWKLATVMVAILAYVLAYDGPYIHFHLHSKKKLVDSTEFWLL